MLDLTREEWLPHSRFVIRAPFSCRAGFNLARTGRYREVVAPTKANELCGPKMVAANLYETLLLILINAQPCIEAS